MGQPFTPKGLCSPKFGGPTFKAGAAVRRKFRTCHAHEGIRTATVTALAHPEGAARAARYRRFLMLRDGDGRIGSRFNRNPESEKEILGCIDLAVLVLVQDGRGSVAL